MEVIPEGTNFRLVSEEELPEIQQILAKFLPDSLKFHQTIHTYLKDRVWQFNFYVSKNWPDDPIILHFPGMTATPNGKMYESFTVFCPKERIDLVDLLQTESVLIDWTQPLYLNFTHRAIMDRIEGFYDKMGGFMEKVAGDVYVLDEAPPEELRLDELQGDDCEVLELREEHAKAIHDLYPANDMESVEVFERLIRALPAYGVFSGGQLAAWMVQSYYGAMFSMQTRPEFRRKGYGIHLAQCLTKSVRERGYIPFVVIRPENDASLSLYNKLGFKRKFHTVRAILHPPKEQEPQVAKNVAGDNGEKATASKNENGEAGGEAATGEEQ